MDVQPEFYREGGGVETPYQMDCASSSALRLGGAKNVGKLSYVKLISTDISVTVAQLKKSKNKVHLFFNFATWRTLPTQSTGPQLIQLVPKHCFLSISQYRSLK